MRVQIEKQIEVQTDINFAGLNEIISAGLKSKDIKDFAFYVTYDKLNDNNISEQDFFIYYGSSHIAIHEILPNGEKSERLLLISNQ